MTEAFATGFASTLTTPLDVGLTTGFFAAFATLTTLFAEGLALTSDFAEDFTAGFAAGLVLDTNLDLIATLELALAVTLGFAATLTEAFALGVALGPGLLTTALDLTGLPVATLGLVGLVGLADLVDLAVLDFTSCLLAGLPCTLSLAFAALTAAFAGFSKGADTARECTGSVVPNPISCKRATIIRLPR